MGAMGQSCSACSALRVVGPALYKITRVRDGLRWRTVIVPVVARDAGCAGDRMCGPCALARSAAAPSSSSVEMAAAPSMSRDPAGWLAAWRETMRGKKSAGLSPTPDASFDDSFTDPSGTSEETAERLRNYDTRYQAATTQAERDAIQRDWTRLGDAEKRRIATQIAARATSDAAARARLVTVALTQGFAAFNRILDGEYGIVIARINAQRDVELARLNARGESERLLLQQGMQPLQATVSTDASGSGMLAAAALVALVLVLKK